MILDKKVKEIMTTDLITITPDIDVVYAFEKLMEHKISAMPVVSDGKMVGIITATDLGHNLILDKYELGTQVEEIMVKNVVSVSPDDTIASAVETMNTSVQGSGILNQLPVIDDNGDLVGIISDGDIILQRKLISNLLDDLKSKYHDVKLNIELTVIPTLKAINRKRNISIGNEYFKQALEDFFHMYLCDLEYLKSLKNYSNSVRDDSEYSRENSVQIIENTYNQITSEDGSGVYDKCLSLLNLLINQSAIVMYILYNVALLNEEELKPFLTSPKFLFGGLNEKGEPDLKYSVRKYIYQIQFFIKFVENNF